MATSLSERAGRSEGSLLQRRLGLQAIELAGCVVFVIVGFRMPYLWDPVDRFGVPIQVIEDDSGNMDDNGGRESTLSSKVLLDLTFDRISNDETVSSVWLAVLTIVLPLVLQCAISVVFDAYLSGSGGSQDGTRPRQREDSSCASFEMVGREEDEDENEDENNVARRDRRCMVLGVVCSYLTTMGMNLAFTEAVKRYAGYMRPNFYQLCVPAAVGGGMECSDPSADPDMERNQAFPSGHASVSFAGMTLFCLFLRRCYFRAVRRQPRAMMLILLRWIYLLLVFLSLSLAIWISTSRIADQLHHPADTVGGALLGSACALLVDGLWT